MTLKPGWLIRKQRRADRLPAAEVERRLIQRQRLQLLFRIKDVCFDIDVWRDQRPGTEFDAFVERAGDHPGLGLLQREYAQLIRIASRRGADPVGWERIRPYGASEDDEKGEKS